MRRWCVYLLCLTAGVFLSAEAQLLPLSNDKELMKEVAAKNAEVACHAEDGDFDKYGRTKVATGMISRSLLKSISVLTPGRGWTETFAEEGTSLFQAFQNVESGDWRAYWRLARRICRWAMWGLSSMLGGLVWLFALLWIVLPLLWCRCCRKGCLKKSEDRQRTGSFWRKGGFWLCWGLGCLFVFGHIYYTAWIRADTNAVLCVPTKTTQDMLVTGLDKNGAHFNGLLDDTVLDQLSSVIKSVQSDLDISHVQEIVLARPWMPVESFTSAWDGATLAIGSTIKLQSFASTDLPFDVKLSPNRDIISATAGFGTVDNPSTWATDTSSIVASAQEQLQNVANARDDLVKTIRTSFNTIRDWYNTVLYHRDMYANKIYRDALIVACLPILGLAIAIVLYFYGNSQSYETQAMSNRRRLAGFMIFGYSFYGILLAVTGGALLSVMYFPSDTCRFITEVRNSGNATRYEEVLGVTVDQKIVEACLQKHATGDLVAAAQGDEWGNLQLDINSIKELVSQITIDRTSIQQGILDPLSKYSAYVVVPMVSSMATSEEEKNLFRTGLTMTNQELTTEEQALIVAQDNSYINWFGTGNTHLPGIQTLVDNLNKLQTGGCDFCFHCTDANKVSVNIKDVAFPTSFDLTAADKAALIAVLSSGGTTPIITSLTQCAPEGTSADFRKFWLSLYVLIKRSAILHEDWTVTKDTGEVTTGPLFFALTDRAHPFSGGRPVSHNAWQGTVADDVKGTLDYLVNASDETIASDISEIVATSSVLGKLQDSYNLVRDRYNCRAVSETIGDLKDTVCDALSGDLASIAIFAVWIAVLHFVAFVALMCYWAPRRRYADRQRPAKVKPEALDKDDETVVVATEADRLGHITEPIFFQACETGDIRTVRAAVEQYAPNSVVDLNYNNTPLHIAAYYGHPAICQLLCDKGWDPNAFNFKRHTPFSACVSNLYLDASVKLKVLVVLYDHGAAVDFYTGEGDTPLMIATRAGEQDIVTQLLDWSANPNRVDGDYRWTSIQLSEHGGNAEITELLKAASARHQ
eukprot:Blabericola_migrator_1__6389@NODE_321_length_9828_cov_184_816720_g260_i0_p1_GENE_NODE_321_length_9828_cov_184_816720_g260_i0NODE_321_length_9828_cov_184_816720_g260_i0_p1_ORF_typecomplete_len1036_score177_00Ank_2/PF12796_7/2_2e10Ank_2/PF12796_7/9_6e09Ank_4/PF13637_6/2_1e07Ank_4/PF13637_6/2_6e07Ank_4/PF13637_6/0_0022Ank_4/PF13637_6/0_00032Ank_5/PF13857_6/9_7e11Ank_5/PF13857_6/5_3e08Ank/PF00023_30/4_2e08Ank/PF00023_30/1e04Ank/PF00023_30/6_6e05Ank/PF00023_30/3_3e03Ank_3/PF13606_6/1_3e07Ank_3/PF1360